MLAAYVSLALVFKTLFYGLAYYISHRAAYSILFQTRTSLVAKLAWAPLLWLQRRHSGELKRAVLQDVEAIETFIAHHTVEVLAAIFSPLLMTLWLFDVDWRLALATVVTAPPALLVASLFMRNMHHQYDEYHQAVNALDSVTVEYVRNIPVMKVFRQDANQFDKIKRSVNDYYFFIDRLTKRTIPGWSLCNSLLSANLFFFTFKYMVLC